MRLCHAHTQSVHLEVEHGFLSCASCVTEPAVLLPRGAISRDALHQIAHLALEHDTLQLVQHCSIIGVVTKVHMARALQYLIRTCNPDKFE